MKEERFWSRVDKTETCWLWHGALNRKGYGSVGLYRPGKANTSIMAHRLAFFFEMGRYPAGELHHMCKVRNCVNPEHLVETDREKHAKEWVREKPRCGHSYDILGGLRANGRRDRLCSVCRRSRRKEATNRWRARNPVTFYAWRNKKAARYRLKKRLAMLYSEAT